LGGVKKYFNNQGWRILHAVEKIAARQGATPLQVALAWQLAQPVITAPIIGANSVEQLQESINAMSVQLDADALEELNEAGAWIEPL
jgi:aryl-alcohol dehydrogenase-like predicted oxidoreductase